MGVSGDAIELSVPCRPSLSESNQGRVRLEIRRHLEEEKRRDWLESSRAATSPMVNVCSCPTRATFAYDQDGTSGEDVFRGIPMAENGSVIAVGQTGGDWDGVNAGSDDFVALRLDADGEEIWRYQVIYTAG